MHPFPLLSTLLACGVAVLGTAAPLELSNDRFKIELAGAEHGMGVLRLEDPGRGTTFWQAAAANPLLWRVDLTAPGSDLTALSRDNRDAAVCRVVEHTPERLRVHWSGFAGLEDTLTVELTIQLDADGKSSWEVIPQLTGIQYTLGALVFPCVENIIDPTREKILFPVGNNGSRIVNTALAGTYPSYEAQLQFFGFLQPQGALYMGLHDTDAAVKFFELSDRLQLSVVNYGLDMSVAGQSRAPRYPVVMAPAASPWECCALYRNWATQQAWTQRGKRSERDNLPPRADEIGLWLNLDGDPAPIAAEALREAARQNTPTAGHWYCWMVHPFDHHYPEFFPPKEGFREAVQAMRGAGMFVVPYLNGRLWDTALASFETVRPEACTRVDGTAIIENYGSGTTLGAMCATSPSYGNMLLEAIRILAKEYGVNGVYIDQIGSVAPTMCYNPAHGHPLGGGGWWQQAYRNMLKPVVDEYGDQLLFVTENGAEPYIDSFDTFLLWVQVYTDDFPSLVAVYNQYAWYMCSLTLPEDDMPSFAGLMSRCLLWNIQPGWLRWLYGADLTNVADAEAKRAYIDRVVRMRGAAREVVGNGLPTGDVIFTPTAETVTLRYHRNTNYGRLPVTPGDFPSYYGVWWRSEDGLRGMALLAELAGREQSAAFTADPAAFGGGAVGQSVYRVYEDGRKERVGAAPDTIPVTLAPYDLQCYILE